MSIRFFRTSIALCCLAVLVASITAFAQDQTCPADASESDAIKSCLMHLKEEARSDSGKAALTQRLARTIVLRNLSMTVCGDKVCTDMLRNDTDLAKLTADAKAIVSDPAKVKAMQMEIMSDPGLMKLIILNSMAADAAMPASK